MHHFGINRGFLLQSVRCQHQVDVVNDSIKCAVIALHDPRPVVDEDRILQGERDCLFPDDFPKVLPS